MREATGDAARHGKPTQRLLWAVGEAHRLRRGAMAQFGQATTGAAATGAAGAGPGGFELHETSFGGGCTYLSVVGSLDGASASRFSGSVRDLVGAGTRSIVVDLTRASVIGGPGLSALREGRILAEAHGGELALRSPPPATLALLERAGLSDYFPSG